MASLIGPPSLRQSPTPPAQHPTGDPFVDLMVKDFNNLTQAPLRPQMFFTENGFATFVTTRKSDKEGFYTDMEPDDSLVGTDTPEEIMADDQNKEEAKKKKKVVIEDLQADDSVDILAKKTESLAVSEGQVDSSFTGLKKKKKKKKPIEASLLNEETGDVPEDAANPWDRDYEELLGRVYNILRENNPELLARRRTLVLRPPQVVREGTKKTVFVNFMDLCKTMHRQPEHVQNFLLAELGTTSGSLDGQQRLVVKGRFAPKDFEGILRRYVNEYVICLGCKSPDTILSKENRLHFLRCQKCGSGRSVAQIKQGFVARVGPRNAAGA